jgi:hypothetical protein
MIEQTNCLDRAGQILIRSIWVEKRLVDFIILHKYPKLVPEFVRTRSWSKFLANERLKYWEKSFGKILEEFISIFEPNKSWVDNLEGVYYWRDIIGHSHISLYRPYILYKPDEKRPGKSRKNIEEKFAPRGAADSEQNFFVVQIDMSDDELFLKMLKIFHEIDAVYFAYIAKIMCFDYEIIR